jgi:exonuclease SbcC
LAELGYDEQEHQSTREAIREHEHYDSQESELEQVLRDLPELEEEIEQLEAQADERHKRVAEDSVKLEALTLDINALDEQITDLAPWEPQLNSLHDQEKQASYRVGAAEQKINTLERQRERREDLIEQRQSAGEQRSIYETLREAFSKNGVPAMIIEAAIPEIENEANELLARMTNGRMHVRFETQRENVTGGVRETLDIQIADEIGTRDYETFSGGEAFRVDFAIRLALSRLLARRAGTQLRTLILDEGFGTQDTRGRERLVQAINSIKDDFDLILVITHIDELKDAFPARIEITKTSQGSMIEIV